MTNMFTAADSTTASDLPSDRPMLMCYVNGIYANIDEVRRLHPDKLVYGITVNAFTHGKILDVEKFDADPSQVGHWLDRYAEPDPWVYYQASNAQAVHYYAGTRHFIRWSAHVGQGEHICGPHTCGYPQADITQWAFHGQNGEHYDQSIGYDYLLPQAPIIPTPPKGTRMINVATNADGRLEVFVEDKNGQIWHTWQTTPGGPFNGAEAGVTNATWTPLGKSLPPAA